MVSNVSLTHQRLHCDTCGSYDSQRQQWYLVSSFRQLRFLPDEQEFHTLNETTLVQSVRMDIDLIEQLSDLRFAKERKNVNNYLNIILISDIQTIHNSRRRSPPIFM